jgi:hypothetical protein
MLGLLVQEASRDLQRALREAAPERHVS